MGRTHPFGTCALAASALLLAACAGWFEGPLADTLASGRFWLDGGS